MFKLLRRVTSKAELAMRVAYNSPLLGLAFTAALVPYILLVIPYARASKAVRKMLGRKPRILWGSTPILSIRHGSKAARHMGYKSDTLVYALSVLDQQGDYDYVMADQIKKWCNPHSMVGKVLLGLVLPYIWIYWLTLRYDIFHFYFDGGILLPSISTSTEIRYLHMAGAKVIVIPYGCEARIRSEALKRAAGFCQHCQPPLTVCNEVVTRKRVEHFCKHGDIVMECSETVGYFPRSDGVWMYPIDTDEWQPVVSNNGKTVRIVHSSNFDALKGTKYLSDAVEQLKAEGYDIELVVVRRVSNRAAKKVYETADIIADQFLAGCYAQFAVEGMALGKPVMCYLSSEFLPWHPEWASCPIVNTRPEQVADKLRELVASKELRLQLGLQGVEYVNKYHGLEAIGTTLDTMYRKLWNNRKEGK